MSVWLSVFVFLVSREGFSTRFPLSIRVDSCIHTPLARPFHLYLLLIICLFLRAIKGRSPWRYFNSRLSQRSTGATGLEYSPSSLSAAPPCCPAPSHPRRSEPSELTLDIQLSVSKVGLLALAGSTYSSSLVSGGHISHACFCHTVLGGGRYYQKKIPPLTFCFYLEKNKK